MKMVIFQNITSQNLPKTYFAELKFITNLIVVDLFNH